jgi:hypothetical protein
MQLDLGYRDVVVPSRQLADYPVILDLPVPRVRTYSRETVVAAPPCPQKNLIQRWHALVNNPRSESVPGRLQLAEPAVAEGRPFLASAFARQRAGELWRAGLFGQIPNGRHLHARSEPAGRQLVFHLVDELQADWHSGVR